MILSSNDSILSPIRFISLRSNGFINKLQPRFEAICERLQEIDNETQKKLWGEVVLKDSEDEDIDFSFRDTSENVFQEIIKSESVLS